MTVVTRRTFRPEAVLSGRRWLFRGTGLTCALLLAVGSWSAAHAQAEPPRVTVTWRGAPIHEALLTLADISERSIVVGAGVTGFVHATFSEAPWSEALDAVLAGHGLVARESESGILRVEPMETVEARGREEAVVTRLYPIRWVLAAELRETLAPLLSERGSVGVAPAGNTLVVTDVPRVQAAIAGLLR